MLPTAWVSEDAPTTGFGDTVAAIAGGITPFHHLEGRRHRPPGDNTVDEQADHVDRTDAWDSGDAYEPYVGRWSRLVAREFLEWLAMPTGWR